MFANIDDIVNFTKNVETLLSDNGVFIVETGYHPEQFKIKMFDYIYHEHFSYFTVGVLKYLFNKCGFEVIDAKRTKPKGGSIRIVAQKQEGLSEILPSVDMIIGDERDNNIYDIEMYRKLSNSLQDLKVELVELLKNIKDKGKSIVALGASHSTTTLIYHFELSDYIEYIVDDNKMKHGLYSPGYHIPVFSSSKIYKSSPDYVLILAWQHSESIIDKHSMYVESGGKFIVPLPDIRIVK
jgi:hypothetical protein